MAIDSRLHFRQPQTVVILALLDVSLIAGLVLYRHGTPSSIHTIYYLLSIEVMLTPNRARCYSTLSTAARTLKLLLRHNRQEKEKKVTAS